MTAADLGCIYLAGGFGTYVSPDSAVRIGLIPRMDRERIVTLGNAAGAGAALLLADRSAWKRARQFGSESSYIELSSSAAFQTHFVDQMMFPQR
jgi:uncharacterized 2Fe-2S/4Fe-4S cluster protein (DUF4445 family)